MYSGIHEIVVYDNIKVKKSKKQTFMGFSFCKLENP